MDKAMTERSKGVEAGRRAAGNGRRPRKILLIEDDREVAPALLESLRAEGYSVELAPDGESGLERATRDYFDLIILDLVAPGRNALEVCRELRQQLIAATILILSARSQTFDKVLGLKIGADDYVTKPFDTQELLARIEAHLRRAPSGGAVPGAIYQFGAIRVDFRRAEVFRHGTPVALSAREFQLLKYFVEHRGATLSRKELLKEVWGYGGAPSTRTVDVHVFTLRRKLEADPSQPQFFQTIIRLGYKFLG
jgi:two-component system, OmpR family, alkaline phosphatase synthesis response regulator PhoP